MKTVEQDYKQILKRLNALYEKQLAGISLSNEELAERVELLAILKEKGWA